MRFTVFLLGCLGMAFAENVKSVLEGYGLKGQTDALRFKVFEHALKATVVNIEFDGFERSNDALLTLHLTEQGKRTVWNVALMVHYDARLKELKGADYSVYESDAQENIKKMFSDGMGISTPEGLMKALATSGVEPYYLRYEIGKAIRGAISTHKILPFLEAKGLLSKDKSVAMQGKIRSATIKEIHTDLNPIDCVLIKAQLLNAVGASYTIGSKKPLIQVLVHLNAGNQLELATPPPNAAKTELFAFKDGIPLTTGFDADFFNFYLPAPEAKKGIISKNEPKVSMPTREERLQVAEAFVAALNDAKH